MPRIFSYDMSGSGDTLFGPISLANNQVTPALAISWDASSIKNVQLQFSVLRGGQTTTGLMILTHDGITASVASGPTTETAATGITWTAQINAGNLELLYTSTNTGSSAQLKYYVKSWN